MVGVHTLPALPTVPAPAAELLAPCDYDLAWNIYCAAAPGADLPDALALNRAVDAVAPVIAAAVLERVYRRLLELAECVPVRQTDAQPFVEAGLRIAAAKTRGLAHELAPGAVAA